MRYYLIAGEASGDLHGANLILALKQQDPEAEIRCWGGDKMAAAGGEVVKHIRDLAFMGFFEVVKHLGTILRNISFCKKDILAFRPEVVILIDYPGFNFRLFKFLKQNNIRIFYYISPQLWAWKTARVYKVKEYVERMFVIFPFEKAFYEKYNVAVDYVGHPLLDELQKETPPTSSERNIIALVPGSRKQEIGALLHEYLKVVKHFPNEKFVVTGMSNIGEEFYRQMIGEHPVQLEMDKTYEVLKRAKAAIVTSGTATLETALHDVPEVIAYKGSWVSYYIAKSLIKNINYICIVNLICDERVVEELIQADVNEARLVKELNYILSAPGKAKIMEGYTRLKHILGEQGASEKAAALMLGYLRGK